MFFRYTAFDFETFMNRRREIGILLRSTDSCWIDAAIMPHDVRNAPAFGMQRSNVPVLPPIW
jgi:hypothetical protein